MPPQPVEAAIALSIVFVAAEIVHGRMGRTGLTERWPWVVAFVLGLLHGLDEEALRAVGLPENAIPTALLFFNLGVELGQLAFVGVVLAFLASPIFATVRAGVELAPAALRHRRRWRCTGPSSA